MKVITQCGKCGGDLEIDDIDLGRLGTCPRCGESIRLRLDYEGHIPRKLAETGRDWRTARTALLIFGGSFAAIWVAVALLMLDQPPTQDVEAGMKLPPISVYTSVVELEIKNESSKTIKSLDAVIDGRYKASNFEYIEPGKTRRISLLTFVDADGNRFQPVQKQAKTVTIKIPGYATAIYRF